MRKFLKGIFKNGSNWTKPSGVSEVEIEFGSWPAKLPSEFTPGDLRQTELFIRGIDKCLVGEYAANIRKIRKPEPYKGKGIRYSGEVIRRKVGKKAA